MGLVESVTTLSHTHTPTPGPSACDPPPPSHGLPTGAGEPAVGSRGAYRERGRLGCERT